MTTRNREIEIAPDQLRAALQADGWRIEKHGYEWKKTGVDWWAWKVFDGFPDCTSNEKPPHVAIIPWVLTSQDHKFSSVQIQVSGEVGGNQWVQFQAYSISMGQAQTVLPRTVDTPRAAWSAAAKTAEVAATED
ncbi:MAG TPA: hypothetical protein VHO25_24850 [Polyangiaceae bacterium]|nr:hypothetical protein [Polyangiaceae bacterium]